MERFYRCIVCNTSLTAYEERLRCSTCNLLFIHLHTRLEARAAQESLEEEPEPEEAVEEDKPYLRSMKSETYHIPPCKYAARIDDPLWITAREAQGLRECGCVKRNG